MIEKINIKGYICHLAPIQGAKSIAYMIYPALEQLEDKWIEKMASQYQTHIAVVYVPADDWNDVLTPWPEAPEAKGFPPFGGKGADFLNFLRQDIIPDVEKKVPDTVITGRDLVGVSLGGLFTLWQWMLCDTFRNIGCISGSFWYDGFIEWFERNPIPAKSGKAFFLLGEEEPYAKIRAYQSVGENTEKIVARLKDNGVNVEFRWVPGNHFSRPIHRAELTLSRLLS